MYATILKVQGVQTLERLSARAKKRINNETCKYSPQMKFEIHHFSILRPFLIHTIGNVILSKLKRYNKYAKATKLKLCTPTPKKTDRIFKKKFFLNRRNLLFFLLQCPHKRVNAPALLNNAVCVPRSTIRPCSITKSFGQGFNKSKKNLLFNKMSLQLSMTYKNIKYVLWLRFVKKLGELSDVVINRLKY